MQRLFAHRKHHAEAGSSADHLIVSVGRFFQGVAFDHGANASQRTEPQRVLGIHGGARWPSPDGAAAKDELQRRNGERFWACSDDDHLSIRTKALDQGRDRFRIGCGGKNQVRAAHGLQALGGRTGVRIDVFVSA